MAREMLNEALRRVNRNARDKERRQEKQGAININSPRKPSSAIRTMTSSQKRAYLKRVQEWNTTRMIVVEPGSEAIPQSWLQETKRNYMATNEVKARQRAEIDENAKRIGVNKSVIDRVRQESFIDQYGVAHAMRGSETGVLAGVSIIELPKTRAAARRRLENSRHQPTLKARRKLNRQNLMKMLDTIDRHDLANKISNLSAPALDILVYSMGAFNSLAIEYEEYVQWFKHKGEDMTTETSFGDRTGVLITKTRQLMSKKPANWEWDKEARAAQRAADNVMKRTAKWDSTKVYKSRARKGAAK